MNDVKKTRKPSENVELSMPLGAAVKKAAETLDIPQSIVRQALVGWAWSQLVQQLACPGTPGSGAITRSYEQALKDITLEHLTAKAVAGRSAT